MSIKVLTKQEDSSPSFYFFVNMQWKKKEDGSAIQVRISEEEKKGKDSKKGNAR